MTETTRSYRKREDVLKEAAAAYKELNEAGLKKSLKEIAAKIGNNKSIFGHHKIPLREISAVAEGRPVPPLKEKGKAEIPMAFADLKYEYRGQKIWPWAPMPSHMYDAANCGHETIEI